MPVIDIKSLQNRLLKVWYVPATSAGLNKLLFFAAAIDSTNEANKAGRIKDIRNYRLANQTFGAKMSADADDAIESLAIILKNYLKIS